MNNQVLQGNKKLKSLVVPVYLFLYIPIITLIIFSFNKSQIGFEWAGFSLEWYRQLFHDNQVWTALSTSLFVALCATSLTTIFSSLLIFFGTRISMNIVVSFFYANLAIPEIVLAIGLLSFFYLTHVPLGITTLIATHTILGLGYMVPILYSRFKEFDVRLVEASLDLGASPIQTFFYIVLPIISPALIGSALLVFMISFDDFILSFFCAGASTQTLPMYIFSSIRSGASPQVSALSTLLLLVSSFLVLLFSKFQLKKIGIV